MSDISSLQEQREHGFTARRVAACSATTARRILSEARRRAKFACLRRQIPGADQLKCAAARKVIRSSLRSPVERRAAARR